LRRPSVDLGLDDRDQPGGQDPARDLELLVDDRVDPDLVGRLDHRAHLGAEDAVARGACQERLEVGDRLHHLGAVRLVLEPVVDLEERHDVLARPEVLRGADALDLPVHGLLEQDRRQDPLPGESRAGDDARAHLVDQVEHLGLVGVRRLRDAVQPQRLGCAAAALVERRDEAPAGPDLLEHVLVHGHRTSKRSRSITLDQAATKSCTNFSRASSLA
jgi:hypothetical protein